MKYSNFILISFISILLVFTFAPKTSNAGEVPNWDIRYNYNNTQILDGGTYVLPINVTRDANYRWPSDFCAYGNIYNGEIFNAEKVTRHSLGSGCTGGSLQRDKFPGYGKYFVVIYPRTNLLTLERYDLWWRTGTSTETLTAHPPDNWGKISFEIVPELPPEDPDPVVIIPGILGSWEKNGEWIIDPVLHTYDNLIETLKLNGYTEGQDLFTLPYDWRESNQLTGLILRDKINEIQEICDCEKVDLVAHSMGGLVARSYIQGNQYEDDVDQLIFLGTPHLGAPKAYLMWEGGEDAEFNVFDRILNKLLNLEARRNGFDEVFEYIHNYPIISLEQLLSVEDYLMDEEGVRVYPNNYPINTFLENLNESFEDVGQKTKIINIIGNTGLNTVEKIRVTDSSITDRWKHGYPVDFDKEGDKGLVLGEGDNTVNISSSSFLSGGESIELGYSHRGLVTGAQEVVYEKMTKKEVSESVNKSLIGRLLMIFILSPADIQVISPDGNIVGKDFTSGEEINNIENSFYSGFLTDNEHITIPDPVGGEYEVQVQGTGKGGEYAIAVGLATDKGLSQGEITSVVLPGETETLLLEVSNEGGVEEIIDITEITEDDIIRHINHAYELGWITDADYRDNLINIITTATKDEGKTMSREPVLLDVFLKRLENGLKDGFINNLGYELLKEDVSNLQNE